MCRCGHCEQMLTASECICCRAINKTKEKIYVGAANDMQLRQPYLNLEAEHVITIKGPTVRKSPPLSVQEFRVQVAIPYLDTLRVNINSHFSGEVVELVVSAAVFNAALLPDDEILLRAYGNSKLPTLANFY